MLPQFLRDIEYPRDQPEIWQGRNGRGRIQPPAGSNDQKGNYHWENSSQSQIPKKIQPSTTKKLDTFRKFHSDTSTLERLVNVEYGQQNVCHSRIMGRNCYNMSENHTKSNDFLRSSERDQNFEFQQIFHTLRIGRNLNQRQSGRNPSHREFFPYGRAQSHSGTSRNGERNSILPTTFHKIKELKAKGQFFQDSPVITGSFQQRKSRKNRQKVFLSERRSKPQFL
ncbi:hypothetical protein O181_131450 [Austropuccinia psidii MF-1]|uniref:Uncharacterized protein n=1 Tax=Austropuccinia psidii MF-1 TaxID=1389203 RepID=A0A9Q3L0X2_9BASI|nr:hypothetical protein [Austropuccinia psidii MF-1]